MIKNMIIICIVAICGNMCQAQSTSSYETTNWGECIQGVHLSIMMTNSVFRVGLSDTVVSVTKNSSTNAIVLDVFAPTIVFDLLLTNNAGRLYHVTTPLKIRGPSQFVTIRPGEESIESIPVTFSGDIEPGDYTLYAMRHFSSSKGDYTLKSNSLKVEIIK